MVADADRSMILDFVAGRPMLCITVLADRDLTDRDVTSVTTDAAAAAVCKGSVGVR
jgi:hypothetical protein